MLNEVKPGGRIQVGGESYGFMGLRGERATAAFKAALLGKPSASLRGATSGLGPRAAAGAAPAVDGGWAFHQTGRRWPSSTRGFSFDSR